MAKIKSKDRDWPDIKRQFIEGWDENGVRVWPNFVQLSKRLGIPQSTIRQRATQKTGKDPETGKILRENWRQDQKDFRAKLEHKRQEKITDDMAKRAVKFDDRCIKIAESVMGHVELHLQKAYETATGKQGQPMAFEELESIGRIANNIQRVARLALGDSTDNLNHNERLSPEERRARIEELTARAQAAKAGLGK